jgi:hypothetical protein
MFVGRGHWAEKQLRHSSAAIEQQSRVVSFNFIIAIYSY